MPLPFWPLRALLGAAPAALPAHLTSRLGNHALRGQPSLGRLAPLEGKRIGLQIRDAGARWVLAIRDTSLVVSDGAPDVVIAGDLADFVLLATRREDPDTLFFARRLSLEGDTETGLLVKNLLDAFEFDWESHWRSLLGHGAAERLLRWSEASGCARRITLIARNLAGTLAGRLAESAEAQATAPRQASPGSPYQ